VYGIFKAYTTRVGSGPFPTEQENEIGKTLRKNGHEFGATTGRPRRCGWLDLVALNYSLMLNGVTKLLMTKADVLTGFDNIKVCTEYNNTGSPATQFPYEITGEIDPSYINMPGWHEDLSKITDYRKLPQQLKNYASYIEEKLKTPISLISVGPDRAETILR